jgi:hypothetical protein
MAIDSISGAFRAAIVLELPSVSRPSGGVADARDPKEPSAGAGGASSRAGGVGSAASAKASPNSREALETQRKVDKLKSIEQGVINHEMAHKGAGGAYAGSVSYTYTTGPDGKRYITGGEVSIDLSAADSPEATVRKMRQVIGAALAPVDPSAQDYRVAARAQALQLEAQGEVAAAAAAERGMPGGASAADRAGGAGEAQRTGPSAGAAGEGVGAVAVPPATAGKAYAAASLMEDQTAQAESVSLYA